MSGEIESFKAQAERLIKECDAATWSWEIPSLERLQYILMRVLPQCPRPPEPLDSVIEARGIIDAYKKRMSEIELAEKMLINLIRHHFLTTLRVLRESYKQQYGAGQSDHSDQFKLTIKQGLIEFWAMTGSSSRLADSEANRIIDSSAYTETLSYDLTHWIGDWAWMIVYLFRPFRTLSFKYKHGDAQSKNLRDLGEQLRLRLHDKIGSWNCDAASASRVVEVTLGYRLNRFAILHFLGQSDHRIRGEQPAYQLIRLGEVKELRHRAIASALDLKGAVSASGRTGPTVLYTFNFTDECKIYSEACNDSLVRLLRNCLTVQRLTLPYKDPHGQWLSRLNSKAVLWAPENFLNVLLPVFNDAQNIELQAPSSNEKIVLQWSPDMALYFYRYGLALPKGQLRYIHLQYEFRALQEKFVRDKEHSGVDTAAAEYGGFIRGQTMSGN